jgi:3-hydroxybutyryl-CoA dehydrogenase
MELRKDAGILVVGAGTMGPGIAQVFATSGYKTILADIKNEALEMAKQKIQANLETLVEIGEISRENAKNCWENLTFALWPIRENPEVDLVVEAVPEIPDLKAQVFRELDNICSSKTILSSTTSSLNVFELAEVSNPERVIIAHFCNPPHIIPLVEIVMGPKTSRETLERIRSILISCGKVPVVLKQYIPGFLVNRLNAALIREAAYIVSKGWASWEDVDLAFKLNAGLKAPFEGPLESVDYMGWDVAAFAGIFLLPHLCNATSIEFAEEMVSKGLLGVKSGKGLKDYTGKSRLEIERIRSLKILKILKAAKELEVFK